MNANPQLPTSAWDDEIDLRQLIETLLHRKWMIVGLVVIAAVVAAVYSFLVATPKYESTVIVGLPSDAASGQFAMPVQAYESFAGSRGVLNEMVQRGGLETMPEALRTRLNIRLEATPRLIRVTAHGPTAEEAKRLAELWQAAFESHLTSYAESYVGERWEAARDSLQAAEAAVLTARTREGQFERDHSLSLKEARLERFQSELIDAEAEWARLTEILIPEDTSRVAALEQLLRSTGPTLHAGGDRVVVPDDGGVAGVTSSLVTVLNPEYLELSRDLIQTRNRLAANEVRAELLQARLEELPAVVEALRAEVVDLQGERFRLHNETATAEQWHVEALRGFQELSSAYSDLPLLTAVTVISEPSLPSGPVSPRKMLNVALAAMLGGFVGVGLAFFQHFWYSAPADQRRSSAGKLG